MCLLNGTWIRTLRHEAAGVLHIGVDCMVHFVLACEIDIQKSIVVSVMIDSPSNLVKPILRNMPHYRYPPDSHLIIENLACLGRYFCFVQV